MRLMKLKRLIITSYVLLIMSCYSCFAQNNAILGNFTLFEAQGKVTLAWSIVKGSTCNGINIHRSTDGLHYVQVGEIPGVCGSSSEPLYYSFVDENPKKNSINYYKLELGNYGDSQVLPIEIIDIENNGYQIRPNPISSTGRIYYDNDRKEVHQLIFFQLNGAVLLDILSEQDYFDVDVSSFTAGIYLFTISAIQPDVVKSTGKVVVSR